MMLKKDFKDSWTQGNLWGDFLDKSYQPNDQLLILQALRFISSASDFTYQSSQLWDSDEVGKISGTIVRLMRTILQDRISKYWTKVVEQDEEVNKWNGKKKKKQYNQRT